MSVKPRNIISLCFFLFFYSFSYGNELYITRDGNIDFFSSTPIEDIKAINGQVSCVLNKSTGEFAFQVPIKGFVFKNALMQEHFNENYLESDLYPKSVFKGKIIDWKKIDLSNKAVDVFIDGELTIHGVKKKIKESGKIWNENDKIRGTCSFDIVIADYDIDIPRIVRGNIAKIIKINIDVNLKKK